MIDGGSALNNWQLRVTPASRIRSGEGEWSHITIDLARGSFKADDVVSRFSGQFNYLEVAMGGAGAWTIKGTASDDYIFAGGGHGDSNAIERGRAGDDRLVSYLGDDTLYGGAGFDQGYADRGLDSCFSIEAPTQSRPDTGCEASSP